ncbi:hypothetical protein R5R35_013565 [Gryllus longicercus]|uniref:Uncharacterized protein n=1 Tax=Gryllus longicercus TaxID=2509291 RepID=A0AAN9VNP3_9ORTH
MDATEKGPERPNPRATAGPFSVLFFWWTRKLFWRGRRSDLTTDDLYDPLPGDRARPLTDHLERHWRREVSAARANQQQPRLTRTLVRAFWHTYAIYGLFVLFHCVVVRVAYPLFLGQVVRYFSASSAGAAQGALAAGSVSKGEALGFAGGLALATALNVLLSHHTNMGTQALGMRVRVAVSSLVYRKVLRLSQSSLARTAAGQLINLLSNDVARFDQLFMYLHYVWVMPLQTIVITYFMWEAVGAAAFVGVGSLFLQTVPVQSYLSKLTGRLRMRVAQRTDERVRLMGEIVAGIQVIKMYAWEKPFQALIESARAREVKVLLHASYLRGVYLAFMVFSERSSLFFTLLAYVLLGHELSADKVFMLAQFFNVLQLSMAIFYPNAVQMAAEASVSVTRIEAFLLLEEQRQALVGAGADALAEPPEKAERIENSVPLLAVPRAGEGEGGGVGVGEGEGGVDIDRLRARWLPNAITDTLSGVTVHVPPGKLCAVIGPVGAGKTSLLLSLLGELPPVAGEAKVGGSVAYAAQEPWLFAASLRSNVVFGRAFDARRYRDVVRACALTRDMQLLPQGDKTPVGDRGAALSGGQRARVNLARAVYRDADIYLLDDPLSAVDAHVGKHLFDECICGFLSDKTRILVTHQLQYLKDADHIVIINNGRVEAQGTYASLSASRINFSALLARSESDLGEAKPPTRRPRARRQSSIASSVSGGESAAGADGAVAAGAEAGEAAVAAAEDEDEEADEATEMLARGALEGSLYLRYIGAGSGPLLLAGVTLLLLLGQLAASGCDFWVTFWTNSEETWRAESRKAAAFWDNATAAANSTDAPGLADAAFTTVLGDALPTAAALALADAASTVTDAVTGAFTDAVTDADTEAFTEAVTPEGWAASGANASGVTGANATRAEIPWLPPGALAPEGGARWAAQDALLLYALLVAACALLTTLRALAFFAATMRSARALHDSAFAAVVRSPMRFFDTNPAGRILNRFSKDLGSIDELLPKAMLEAIQVFLVMVSILVMVIIVNAYFIIVVVVLGFIFYKLRTLYLATAQDIKRLEGITKSPVYSHVAASLTGLTTIRAARAQERLRDQFDELQDENTACWYLSVATSCAFGFCLDLFSLCFVSAVTFSFLIADDGTQGGWVGLAVSQALILTGMVQHGVRLSADAAAQMTSVERVAQFARLEPEPPLETDPAHKPLPGWPQHGEIQFDHLSLRYSRGDPPVLRDLCFSIEGAHKVGVVGRTGAGKSSLIAALFRLAPLEGAIRVDRVNTQQLGLHELRRALAIIPQEPVLFSGTLRFNLSPFAEFSDAALWAALDEVELKDAVEALDAPVAEGGANFSVGQRQLVCLARAILRDNRILVLDEATANVDPQTDALIQETIRRKFGDRTVLTIAHRLNTIMDSDKVLVMDAGQAVEYDHPHILLQNKESIFYGLVQETDKSMAEELAQIAEKSYNRKRQTEDLVKSRPKED